LDLCLCVVVVLVVGVVLLVGVVLVVEEDEELLLPHPATAMVLARTARAVSMAVSGVLLMGRAPVFARRLRDPPYQAPAMLADLRSVAVG
jgi:hypothetical protein